MATILLIALAVLLAVALATAVRRVEKAPARIRIENPTLRRRTRR
jgi:hypothetical protein